MTFWSPTQPGPLTTRTAPAAIALAGVYLASATLGLAFQPVAGFATLVWPPAGIALAAVVLFGNRIWPGIAVGALLANLNAGAPAAVAVGIAIGNTSEALLGGALLRAVPGFTPALARRQDVLALVAAAGLGPALAGIVGVSSLVLGGVTPAATFFPTWTAWWLGDGIGVLTLCPALLVWAVSPPTVVRRRIGESILLGASILVVGGLVFIETTPGRAGSVWQLYMLSPLLIWSALRFEQRGAATAILLVSAIAISATASGLGPFQGGLSDRLRSLQAFMALMTVTFLILGSVAAERRAAEERLVTARNQAESANEAKTKFLAMMSHELRTPLTGIIGYASLLTEGLSGPLGGQQAIQIGRIRSAAWHLVQIIESILTFARTEAGHEEARIEDVDAVSIVREALDVLEPEAGQKGIEMRLHAPPAPVTLQTDPGKLRQILLNVIGNAVKFSDVGPIEVRIVPKGKEVHVEVSDHGPGIPSGQLDTVFQPFIQLDQSDTRTKGGTGLGLPVARSLARLLGGDLLVHSRVGAGSTFTLRLMMDPSLVMPVAPREQP